MAIQKIELSAALNSLATQTSIDKVTGMLGGAAANISKADLATVVAEQSIFNKFLTPYTNAVGTVDEISKVGLCEYTGIGVYLCIIYGTDSPKEYYWIGYIVSNGNPEAAQRSIKLANNNIEISMGWFYRPSIKTEATNLKLVSYKIA